MTFPRAFLDRYEPIAPAGFADALAAGLGKTLRTNFLKTTPAAFERRAAANNWQLTPLGIAPGTYAIERGDRRRPLGHSLEHFAGHCYIQEASSMIPPVVLDPRPGEAVLDLAAAPGSKTTQLAAQMDNQGVLIANDVSIPRIKALAANVERSGCLNVGISNLAGVRIGRFAAGRFDKVLVDAPCTAEGTLAKSPEALDRWSEKSINKLALIQSKLLLAAWQALKPGGRLVYSTCTFAPEENEGVVHEFLTNHPEAVVEPVELPGLPLSPGLTEWRGRTFRPELARAARVWPGERRMEGFFICAIRKPDIVPQAAMGNPFADRRYGVENPDATEWLQDRFGWPGWNYATTAREKGAERWEMTPDLSTFDTLPLVRRGLRMARTVTGGFKPTTDWIQLVGDHLERHTFETEAEQTADYLSGLDLPVKPPRGYLALRQAGLTYACGLGQEKGIKNQLPTSRRILPRPSVG